MAWVQPSTGPLPQRGAWSPPIPIWGWCSLLAPLAAVADGVGLEEGIETVLEATTVDDSLAIYRAIRLAQPGGMGDVADQDLASEPTMRLRDIMRLAADRDLIARQYANGFQEVLGEALSSLRELPGLRPGSGNRHRGSLFEHPRPASRFVDRTKSGNRPGSRGLAAVPRSSKAAGQIARRPRRSATRSTTGFGSLPPAQPRHHGRPGHGRLVRRLA